MLASDLLIRCKQQRDWEGHTSAKVNGLDLLAIEDEELGNMSAIVQLILLWLSLHLGPGLHGMHKLRPHPQGCKDMASSQLWALDDISGNVSAVQTFFRGLQTVQCIGPITECLTHAYLHVQRHWQASGSLVVDSPELSDTRTRSLFRLSTYYASTRDRGKPKLRIVGVGIMFSALLLCFQSTIDTLSEQPREIGADAAHSIIQACASVALSLCDTVGHYTDPAGSGCLPPSGLCDGLTISDMACESSFVLIVISGVADSLELLLSSAIDKPISSRYRLCAEASSNMAARSGWILGIIDILVESLEHFNLGDRKTTRAVEKRMTRLKTQLEFEGVEADFSFVDELRAATVNESNESSRCSDGRTQSEDCSLVPITTLSDDATAYQSGDLAMYDASQDARCHTPSCSASHSTHQSCTEPPVIKQECIRDLPPISTPHTPRTSLAPLYDPSSWPLSDNRYRGLYSGTGAADKPSQDCPGPTMLPLFPSLSNESNVRRSSTFSPPSYGDTQHLRDLRGRSFKTPRAASGK